MSDFKNRVNSISELIIRVVSSKYFLGLVFAWFILQAIFFATSVSFGLPPDERDHLGFIDLFVSNHLSPFLTNQEGYYILGESVRNPFFLYHYLLAFPYAIVHNLDNAYIYLRLINVGLGATTLYLLLKIARLANISRFATNISLFALASTVMFTFLFSSISYDNLFVLLAILSVYLLIRFAKSSDSRTLITLCITLAAGLLVKVTFIPITAIILVCLVVLVWRGFGKRVLKFRKSFLKHKLVNVLLLLALVLPVILIGQRYVVNLFTYHTYAPDCTQVLTIEQCRQNPLFVRNEMIYDTNRHAATKNFAEYTGGWLILMGERTYGVFGHKSYVPSSVVLVPIVALLALGIFAVIRLWKQRDKTLTILIAVSVVYSIIVLIENYSIYLASGRATFAVHGRYLFAVLPLIYLVAAHFGFKALERRPLLKALTAVIIIGVFFAASLPMFLLKVTPEWYGGLLG